MCWKLITPWVKFYFGLTQAFIFLLENACYSWCMYQTGLFSSAFVVSQSKFTGKLRAQHLLCHKVNLLSCIVKRPLCYGVNLPSRVARRPLFHKVNLPRCEARRYHFIMTCDIFGTGQTNILSLCYLFGKTTWHIPVKALMIPLKRVKLRGVV